ncbi:Y-family DNA polymerase [Spirosoma daeguense]
MSALNRFVEEVEVYSIDEAFIDLNGYETVYPNLDEFARIIRQCIDQWTRIPVSVGIAPTKTLCKIANYYAKRISEYNGVFLLDTRAKIDEVLQDFDVADMWGIGDRYASLLKRNDIRTAAQYRDLLDDWLRQKLTVNGLRLAYELRGRPCKLLELEPKPKKTIMTAPSFDKLIPDLAIITEALTTYVGRAAEKLRKQNSAAGTITVFIHTNPFKKSPNGELAKQYSTSRTVNLPHATSSTFELATYAQALLESIFRFGYEFKKVGIILSNLVPVDFEQQGLFTTGPDRRTAKLAKVIDKLNYRYGRDKVRIADAGFNPTWHHKRQFMSPYYTTQWKDILRVS